MRNLFQKKKWLNIWIILLTFPILFINAQSGGGPSGSGGFIIKNPIGSKTNNILSLVGAVLDFVTQIGTIIVVLALIYSGYCFIKANGDEGAITKAKKIFFYTVIGGIVLIGARALGIIICQTAVSLGMTNPGCPALFDFKK